MNRLRIPTTNTTQQTIVAAIINDIYREIYSMEDWWWLEKFQVIITTNDYNTGTILVTNGSTAATLSTASASSLADRVLIIPGEASDSGVVTRISTHAAAGTAVTLDANYSGATASAASFNVYQDQYDLASDVGKVLWLRRFGYQYPLDALGPMEMANLKNYDTTTGKPQLWTVHDFDTTGDPTTVKQLWIHPYPDATYRMEVVYKQTLNTELSGSTRPLIPDDYVDVLTWGALSVAYPLLLADSARGAQFDQRYNRLLGHMIVEQRRRGQDYAQVVPENQYARTFRHRRNRSVPAGVNLGSTWFGKWPIRP